MLFLEMIRETKTLEFARAPEVQGCKNRPHLVLLPDSGHLKPHSQDEGPRYLQRTLATPMHGKHLNVRQVADGPNLGRMHMADGRNIVRIARVTTIGSGFAGPLGSLDNSALALELQGLYS